MLDLSLAQYGGTKRKKGAPKRQEPGQFPKSHAGRRAGAGSTGATAMQNLSFCRGGPKSESPKMIRFEKDTKAGYRLTRHPRNRQRQPRSPPDSLRSTEAPHASNSEKDGISHKIHKNPKILSGGIFQIFLKIRQKSILKKWRVFSKRSPLAFRGCPAASPLWAARPDGIWQFFIFCRNSEIFKLFLKFSKKPSRPAKSPTAPSLRN